MAWIQEAIKTGIVSAATALIIYLWKKAIPFWKKFQKIVDCADVIDKLLMESEISKAKQMAVLYVADSALFITNAKGEVIFANAKWLKITGIPSEKDAYGYGYMSVIADDGEVEKVEKKRDEFLKHPSTYKGTVRFRHYVTGEILVMECVSEPYFYMGNLVETVGRITVIKS